MKAFYRLFYYISILLSCILAGVTIAGAFSGTASPDSFKFMPFIGLGLPILLLVNLASAVYWTIRWRCWVFIPLIAIFSNWVLHQLCSPIPASRSGFQTDSQS